MSVIVCDQFAVLGDSCPGCGGWLHRVVRNGFPGHGSMRFCEEDCIADDQERVERLRAEREAQRAAEEMPAWVVEDMERMRRVRGTTEPWEPAEFDAMARERGWP